MFSIFGICVYYKAPTGIDVALFGLTFLFSNFGPNGAIFMIPDQIFPSDIRATCAAGKLGSVVGVACIPLALERLGLIGAMFLCTGVARTIARLEADLLVPKS